MKNTPKSCLNCKHRIGCRSWYGGIGCKYKDSIAKIRKEG